MKLNLVRKLCTGIVAADNARLRAWLARIQEVSPYDSIDAYGQVEYHKLLGRVQGMADVALAGAECPEIV